MGGFGRSKSPEMNVKLEMLAISAVFECAIPTNEEGAYILDENGAFGPAEPDWSYTAPDKYSFYSAFISGAHRMKNGNTLITRGCRDDLWKLREQ